MIFMSSARVYAISCWWLIVTLALFLTDSEIWLEDSAVGILWSAGDNCTGKIHDDTGIIYELLTHWLWTVTWEFSCTHWHELACTATQCWRQVCTVFTQVARNQCVPRILNMSKFSARHGTQSRTLHAFFTHSSRSFAKSSRTGTLQFVNQIRASVNWP